MSGKLQECQMSEPLPELIPAKAATSPGIPATAPDKHRQVAAFTPEGWPPSPDSVAAFVRIGWTDCSGIRRLATERTAPFLAQPPRAATQPPYAVATFAPLKKSAGIARWSRQTN